MPLRVRAIAFDMDGVLIDSEAANVQSAFEAFGALGLSLKPRHRSLIVGRHPDDYIPQIADDIGVNERDRLRARGLQDEIYVRTWADRIRMVDGAREVLNSLRTRGYPVALATSGGREHVHRCLERFALTGLFDAVLTKEDVKRRKPHPEIYELAAKRLGVAPGELLAVEDSEHGVRAAQAAGAVCVAIRTEHAPPGAVAAADTIIDRLEDLLALVE